MRLLWLVVLCYVYAVSAELTVHVSSLDSTYSLSFPTHTNLTVQMIREELGRRSPAARDIALCRPPLRNLFSTDYQTETELDPHTLTHFQGVNGSWLSPRSITLNQNWALVEDLWTGGVVAVTACRGSEVGQVLGRVVVSGTLYPKGTSMQCVETDDMRRHVKWEQEVRPVGHEPDPDLKPIKAKPDFTKVIGEHLWMAAGWVRSVKKLSDSDGVVVECNSEPSVTLFAPISTDTAEFVRVDGKPTPDSIPVIGAIPNHITADLQYSKVKRVDVLYGILFDGTNYFEIAIPQNLKDDHDRIKRYVQEVSKPAKVTSVGDFTDKFKSTRVTLNPTIIHSTKPHTPPPPTKTTPPQPEPTMSAALRRYRLRWNSSQPETKAVVLATAMFTLAAIVAVIYFVVSGAVQVDDPVLEDVERDLADTERIQSEYM